MSKTVTLGNSKKAAIVTQRTISVIGMCGLNIVTIDVEGQFFGHICKIYMG